MGAMFASSENPSTETVAERRILVVEDDPDICFSLSAILKRLGFDVVVAGNGQEALDYLEDEVEVPCLILLDLMMPIMDGWSFRTRQLEEDALATIPVCVISGATDLADEVTRLGITDFLQKPFGRKDVEKLVERYCCPK